MRLKPGLVNWLGFHNNSNYNPKKLWQSLRKVLHRTSETVLPAHSSDKSLADMFASFFSNKISKIRDTFSTSGSFNDAPDSLPPAFNGFMPVTEDEVYKCISESPTKSCSLDPIPTFLLKDCLDILISSITKLVNHSLIEGSIGFNQYKLQSIQNTLARIVTNHEKYAHVTPILQKLDWLPVRYRCIFKTATLVYKFLHSGSPSYFEPFLSFGSCPYSTRHSHPDRQYLTVPPFHSSVFKSAKHFSHSLAFDAPKIWNDLPQDVRGATSVASFRKKLKTYLFAKAYPP